MNGIRERQIVSGTIESGTEKNSAVSWNERHKLFILQQL